MAEWIIALTLFCQAMDPNGYAFRRRDCLKRTITCMKDSQFNLAECELKELQRPKT